MIKKNLKLIVLRKYAIIMIFNMIKCTKDTYVPLVVKRFGVNTKGPAYLEVMKTKSHFVKNKGNPRPYCVCIKQ